MINYDEESEEEVLEEEDFEGGLNFEEEQDPLETVETIRRRRSSESEVEQATRALSSLGGTTSPRNPDREHFSPVQVRFPVAAPELRPDFRPDPLPELAMAPAAVNYDEATATEEDDGALDAGIRACKNIEFDGADLKFFFGQAELKMKQSKVKKNYTKYLVMTAILPKTVTDHLKSMLRKQETELGDKPYKKLKDFIFKIFGPPANADFERAMSRVLLDKPSQLARTLLDDLCEHELDGCCCYKFIYGLWHRQLPTPVRQGIAHMDFSAATFEAVIKRADDVFSAGTTGLGLGQLAAVTTGPAQFPTSPPPSMAAAAAVATAPPTPQQWSDTAFHQYWPDQAQTVAAIHFQRGRGRGRGRGGQGFRGGQGRGGGRGAQRGQGQQGQVQNQGNGQTHPRHKGVRHQDGPPIQVCKQHWIHGKSAFHCLEPGTCPWRDYYVPRANNQ